MQSAHPLPRNGLMHFWSPYYGARAGHVAHMGEGRSMYRVLVGKPEGKTSLGRARHRWEDNTKMDHQEVGWEGMDWIDLAQDRDRWRALVNVVMNLWVP